MKKQSLLFCAGFFLVTALPAQQKTVSYEQAFEMAPTDITRSLPTVSSWLNDEEYIETIREGRNVKSELVNVKTGERKPYKAESGTPQKDVAIPTAAKNATWSPDNGKVAFTLNNDLYVIDAASGQQTRLTNDGSEAIKNGYASWVYFEEILGRGSRYRAFWWSPDSRKIAYLRFDDSKVPTFPIYVIKDQRGYLENEHYPKPGDPNPEVRLGIANVADGNSVWADFNEKDDQYFGEPYWTPDGELWAQWMNRGQDQLRIFRINQSTGAKSLVYQEDQSTWIDLDKGDRVKFLPAGKGFFLKSDKSGWAQLYWYDMNGKLLGQPTNGEYTVGSIFKIDEKSKTIYFNARKENSARWDLYSASFDGKKMTRHSFGDYNFTGMAISPNNKYFVTSYSNINTPTTLVLMDMKGRVVRELGNAKGEAFADYALPKKELVRVKSSDGQFDLPVLIIYPLNFDPNKKYPVLASIYGGPNSGRVMDSWQSSASELWWANEGMIQVVFDNRSSGHFGKKGMNYIHRQMGKYEIEDYMDCAKWLRNKPWVDGERIGITGGSFGGYMTCMALTYGSDVFTHGVANASVTDWQFYDTHYTERYMDTPQENPEGYKLTSVMTYADRLKGLLRIVHGTSDDNVHMQNSLVLIDKLQNLKKHFEFMLYPGERHGIGGNNGAKGLHNRTEAYKFYYDNLLRKPMPEVFWKPVGQKGF
ncbi:MAG: S9 family peptidase [Chitinophagaceae bacterium]